MRQHAFDYSVERGRESERERVDRPRVGERAREALRDITTEMSRELEMKSAGKTDTNRERETSRER